ncbi:MAG: roadblock/LC7 domain-containing protein [Thaumarchaeota archaeon]|nr:roadblock/LC7 domain-containing protein [Candidatus Geocrenenecus arthurdayi]MCL7389849.1 roadblock/LC7 domain-containing protein [Candidatus Geocrenenecus arthurdayi]MCL7391210.1 roadblock/LC7 domain-containing protein [Candidatus Geocrenenecus arthurdayi]MCL7403725.1 roadblock/LC7 domain-containing protein [Candidatus Geocrenenecus arthurdayi]
MSTRAERIRSVVSDFMRGNPDVTGVSIISAEGLVIESSLPSGVDEEKASAAFSALQSIVERVSDQVALGKLNFLILLTDKGGAILYPGKKASLVVLMSPKAKIGLLIIDVKDMVEKLKDVLD